MAQAIFLGVKAFDKAVSRPAMRKDIRRAQPWHQHDLYISEQANGIWPATHEDKMAMMAQMAREIEQKLPNGNSPVILSYRFTSTLKEFAVFSLIYPQSMDIAWCKRHAIMQFLPWALLTTFNESRGGYGGEEDPASIFSVEWKPFIASNFRGKIPLGAPHKPSFAKVMEDSITIAKNLSLRSSNDVRGIYFLSSSRCA